ncbi:MULTISPECIES: AAA family ATPase [Pseudomonas]|uniref:AAA family ATPase n=2 Tax=Pseudomonas TaxID=286 RepID=A0A9Q6IKG8_9PSED|nr:MULTISPECIES: AAA family ATPase [Pseudomonas]MBW8356282.1 AAA family ATPase [Pseudomonas sp.]MCY7261605.1 AAA family ATPase [Pseudomonas protegens]MDC7814487.1 AAA family ATPase [Pseudomonas sp. BLCC-B112]MDD1019566.1 AAA family ATPase [Pseudomonas idahonensis]MDD1151544.1 AAA family ATPase [Pseudomonas idahonensis]
MAYRIHIFGASGSGTTTLGRALAERLCCKHFDSDDFFWQPGAKPFSCRRPRDARIHMLQTQVLTEPDWVLSGSLCGWGDVLIPSFTLAVFVQLDPEVRLQRLRAREFQRYGEQIFEGGERYVATQTFLAWAAGYDEGGHGTRSLRRHESWIKNLDCPLVRLDSTRLSVPDLCGQLLKALDHSIIA